MCKNFSLWPGSLAMFASLIMMSCGGGKENELVIPPPASPPPPPEQVVTQPTLLFKSGFEGTTRVENRTPQHDLIRGSDNTDAPDDWQVDVETNLGGAQIVYEQGNYSLRKAEIVADPENAGNKVLRTRITDQHILLASGERKARIQYDIQNKKPAPDGGYLKEYYQKCRLYFSTDFSVLENAGTDNIGWFIMQEFANDPSWDVPLAGGGFRTPALARTNVEVVRRNGKLRFGAKGRSPSDAYPPTWEVINTDFAIPFGKWITQEIYVKEGNSSTGRFYLAVTVDGVKTVLVDKTGATHSLQPGHVPDGQTSWNPIKVYSEGKLLSWFKNAGKILDVYWDDLEIYKDKRP